MPKTCGHCRYWSELIARAGGGTTNPSGLVEAMCINTAGPRHSTYTTAGETCPAWGSGEFGAVDEPGSDNVELYRAADAQETGDENG